MLCVAGRVRNVKVVDRETGQVTSELVEHLPPAGFTQRARELQASAPDLGDVRERAANLICDGCGAVAELDYAQPVKPPGWAEKDDGDFCPACVTAGRPASLAGAAAVQAHAQAVVARWRQQQVEGD
jgi:hypothetical protein